VLTVIKHIARLGVEEGSRAATGFAAGFEERDLAAPGLAQADGCRQPADTGADNGYF
jgi:hypothetical protein